MLQCTGVALKLSINKHTNVLNYCRTQYKNPLHSSYIPLILRSCTLPYPLLQRQIFSWPSLVWKL